MFNFKGSVDDTNKKEEGNNTMAFILFAKVVSTEHKKEKYKQKQGVIS